MKISTQILIDRYIGRLICKLIDVFNFLFFKNNDQITPEKICIILMSEMGSLTLCFPMINILKKKYPLVDIFILTLKKNDEIIKIMELVPESNLITIDDSTFIRFLSSLVKSIKHLKSHGIDTIIDCELFARISSILSFLSGAKIRAGFYPYTQEGLFRGNHINRRVLYNPYLHISEQFINLAESIDSKEHPRNKRIISGHRFKPDNINISDQEKQDFKKRLDSCFPDFANRPIVVINPGGGVLPIRAWPVEHYCVAAESLLQSGYSIAVTGVNIDKNTVEKIVDFCSSPYCVDMAGFTRSIYELLILFSISKFLITNDSGPGHFSSLVSLPGIVLFGPETPVLYGSLNPNAVNMYADTACSPCLTAYNHRRSPCNKNNLCLKSITPEQVLNKAYEVLSIK